MDVVLPTCACGCGAPLVKRGTGPSPRYASATCRKRAQRRRLAGEVLTPFEALVHAKPRADKVATAEVQIAQAVLEARAIGFAFLRLASEAHPSLGWRCGVVGQTIIDKLSDTFGKEAIE